MEDVLSILQEENEIRGIAFAHQETLAMTEKCRTSQTLQTDVYLDNAQVNEACRLC